MDEVASRLALSPYKNSSIPTGNWYLFRGFGPSTGKNHTTRPEDQDAVRGEGHQAGRPSAMIKTWVLAFSEMNMLLFVSRFGFKGNASPLEGCLFFQGP